MLSFAAGRRRFGNCPNFSIDKKVIALDLLPVVIGLDCFFSRAERRGCVGVPEGELIVAQDKARVVDGQRQACENSNLVTSMTHYLGPQFGLHFTLPFKE